MTLSSTKPTRTGYTFKGWGETNTATSTVTTYKGNAAKTFYAVWQINTYTVSYANGGRGTAPASHTKTYGTNLTLRAGLGVVSNYRFSKWKATDGTLYDGSGTYSKNAATTMTAQWIAPYTVSYNGNGATGGSTSAQTKVHDTTLTLQSNGFTRTNYAFSGWNTRFDGGGTPYSAGQGYTANAAVTLYAQWTQIYASPTLTISKTYRADSSGTASDEGTYLALEANYSIYSGGNNAISSWLAECNEVTETVPVSGDSDSSGTVKFILPANLSAENSYPVTLTLIDTNGGASGLSSGTITKTATLGVAAYPLDAQRFEDDGSYGVAIGGLSTRKGFDVFSNAYFRERVCQEDGGMDYSTPPSELHFGPVFETFDSQGSQTHYQQTVRDVHRVYRSYGARNPSNGKVLAIYLSAYDDGTLAPTLTPGAAWPIANGGTGATTAAGARTALGLGSFATRSSLGVAVTVKDGSVKDSTARSSGANYQIDITLAAESGYMPISVVAVTTNSGQAFLRGFDLDDISTGGTPKVKTYWRANAAMSANTVTYTAQVMLIKTTLP